MTEEERAHRERMLKFATAKVRRGEQHLNTYSCPTCGDDLSVADRDATIYCLNCDKTFRVNRDAEFRGGLWRDLTTLEPL